MTFSKYYPCEPPKMMKFSSAIFHPNISPGGEIEADVLRERYITIFRPKYICNYIPRYLIIL